VESAAISQEIERLESEVSSLRERMQQDNSSFSTLEQQIAELRERLSQTEGTLRMQELRLAEKQVALAEAQRLERLDAFEDDLRRFREAGGHLSGTVQAFLDELEAYDAEAISLRKLLDDMRDAFGDDERVTKVAATLTEEGLDESWRAVVEATQWRIVEPQKAEEVGEEKVEQAAPENGKDISEDLQKRAEEGRSEEGRASRILDYFSKS
jgi:predicted  nucleic acid-binding Zn-ribbon protein